MMKSSTAFQTRMNQPKSFSNSFDLKSQYLEPFPTTFTTQFSCSFFDETSSHGKIKSYLNFSFDDKYQDSHQKGKDSEYHHTWEQERNVDKGNINKLAGYATRKPDQLFEESQLSVSKLLEKAEKMEKTCSEVSGENASLKDHLQSFSTSLDTDLDKNLKQSKRSVIVNRELSAIANGESKKKISRIRPLRPTSQRGMVSQEEITESQNRVAESIEDPSLLTNQYFSERTDIHPLSRRAVTEVLGLTQMTEIQSKTFELASRGNDILASARTGTGKTVAYLLPSIEIILKNPNAFSGANVGVLVISPTRELATQIATEAKKLLTFHKRFSAKSIHGGTKIISDLHQLNDCIPTILVATPGRLLAHLESTKINGRKFYDIVSNVKVLILDETDQLLTMGFRKDIKKIFSYIPRKRQSMMFYATFPSDARHLLSETLKDNFTKVDCINNGDQVKHTNSYIEQSYAVIPSIQRYVTAVIETIIKAKDDCLGNKETKIVVFFPTARHVGYFAEMFNLGLKIPVLEIHSRKSQNNRNRTSEQFRAAKSGILFTSDVSARGVDYPNVSHVIQFGIPYNCEQYIHRIGRTGRAGKNGRSWLIISSFERKFLSYIQHLKIKLNLELTDMLYSPVSPQLTEKLSSHFERIQQGDKKISKNALMIHRAVLGYYDGKLRMTNLNTKEELVAVANEMSLAVGLKEVPRMRKRIVRKMGLLGVPGIKLICDAQAEILNKMD